MFTWLPDHISQAMFRPGNKSESQVYPITFHGMSCLSPKTVIVQKFSLLFRHRITGVNQHYVSGIPAGHITGYQARLQRQECRQEL